jgi:hypothetical protein
MLITKTERECARVRARAHTICKREQAFHLKPYTTEHLPFVLFFVTLFILFDSFLFLSLILFAYMFVSFLIFFHLCVSPAVAHSPSFPSSLSLSHFNELLLAERPTQAVCIAA